MGFNKQRPATKAQAGDGFSVVLNNEHEVYVCGKGNYGRLGLGYDQNCNWMTQIKWFTERGVKIKDIAVGGRHCLAISKANFYDENLERQTQNLYGWGFNFHNQIGIKN